MFSRLIDPFARKIGGRRKAELFFLVIIFLAFHLPFLNQGFVIDDGNFVDQALQILDHPTEPYSFTIHLAEPEDFYTYFANPPGQAYFLALAIKLFGNSEDVTHTACMLLSLAAVIAMYKLSREVNVDGFLGALLFLISPAFLISSHTVMSDVPATAFYIIAILLTFMAVDGGGIRFAIGAGLAASMAALFKYSGISVLPLMLLYPILRKKWHPVHFMGPIICIALFSSWCLISYQIYGSVHFLAAFSLESVEKSFFQQSVQIAASIIGMGSSFMFPLALLAWSIRLTLSANKVAGGLITFFAVIFFIAALPEYGINELTYNLGNRILGGFQFAAGISAVALTLFMACQAVPGIYGKKEKDDEKNQLSARIILLIIWFGGFLILNATLLFATPKYLVPAIAPLILLLLVQDKKAGSKGFLRTGWILNITIVTTILLSIALLVVNAETGSFSKIFVSVAKEKTPKGNNVWFNGHLAVRHYAKQAGMYPIGIKFDSKAMPSPGDIFFHVTNIPSHGIPIQVERSLELIDIVKASSSIPITLMNSKNRAGYWSHLGFGILPYVFTTKPPAVAMFFHIR